MSIPKCVPDWFGDRCTGVLLHPTSLPGKGELGVLGKEAYHFVDFLLSCGAKVWQFLPLVPTHEDRSPYMGLSVLAGNPDLICLDALVQRGWLDERLLVQVASLSRDAKRQTCMAATRAGFLRTADAQEREQWRLFQEKQQYWLQDFALFCVIRRQQSGSAWTTWPLALRDRDHAALLEYERIHREALTDIQFEQYLFSKQWSDLKRYANEKGIRLFGDMPIFVAHDSAEVWANPGQFDLLADGSCRTVAGVPPDYFSATGQRWGNPHYNWRGMKDNDFSWWRQRVAHGLETYDLIRIDHFRGFESYWEIDAEEPTAIKGRWVKTPGKALFKSLSTHFPTLPLVAEDLGSITPEVLALRDQFNFPGMKILQFGFDGDAKNPYLPHNYPANCVVYTGTHDNDTSINWYRLLAESSRNQLLDYLGVTNGEPVEPMPWPLIRMAVASTAVLAMIPMQDLLSLGDGHRMNTPGSQIANWRWRFDWSQIHSGIPEKLRAMNRCYGRL